MTRLADIAPRLARAVEAERRVIAARVLRERRKQSEILRLERLVAHRELQLVRAYSTCDRRYIKRRAEKLDSARSALEHVRRDLVTVADWEPEWAA